MSQHITWIGSVRVVIASPGGGSEPHTATWVVDLPPERFRTASIEERHRHAVYLEFDHIPPGSLLRHLADTTGTASCHIDLDGETLEDDCRFLWVGPDRVRAIHPDRPSR